MGQERRAFPRRPFVPPVQAYENGARFACKPVDLSLGGAFLRTRSVESFRTDELISVVFAADAGWSEPIYLFARVVRLQADPPGLGLSWERAVTAGDAAYLARFLNATLGLKTQVATEHTQTLTGRFRSVFPFDLVHRAGEQHRRKAAERLAAEDAARVAAVAPAPAPVATPVPKAAAKVESALSKAARAAAASESADPLTERVRVPSPSTAGSPRATRSIVSRLADSRGVARHGVGASNPFEERTPSGLGTGVLTDEIRAVDQAVPTTITATLEIDGKAYPATISSLGSSRLTVVAVSAPSHVPGRLRLATDLPVPDGPRPIIADCAVHGFQREAEGTVYDLAIDALDEDGDPGVLLRYVKFLYFQAIASGDA
jgi:hypothetical protein